MMSEATQGHTPLPWTVEGVFTVNDANGRHVVAVSREGLAPMIVAAVNSYPQRTQQDVLIKELVGALEILLGEAESFSVSGVYFSEPSMGHKGPDLARAALASVAPPAPALWAPIPGKVGLTRDGRKVVNLRQDADGDWLGDIVGGASNDTWNPDGSYFFASDKRRSDLVACADEVAG